MHAPTTEPRAVRLRRLRMRSWRRGMREVDLILGRFADAELDALNPALLEAFEALLDEPDLDLYRWTTAADRVPDRHAAIVGRIRDHHRLA